MSVYFRGGPLHGQEVRPLFARAVELHKPPYFCAEIDGTYEHYVCANVFEDHSLYVYAGPCRHPEEHE